MKIIADLKYFVNFADNASEILDTVVEVEVFNAADLMQEMMSPTFIVLASCVAVATLIVILLIGLICRKICHTKTGYAVPNAQVRGPIINNVTQ